MIIAVDFDGTIVEHAYPKIGKPVPFALEVLKRLQQEEFHTLIMWTVREGSLLREAVDYCAKNGLEFYAVNNNHPDEEQGGCPRKLMADIFIDDKNIGGLPDWSLIYKTIKSGRIDFTGMEDVFLDNPKPARKRNFFIQIGEALENAQKYKKR